MTVAWYRFRRTFGRRGVGYLGAVVLIALLGGVSLASLAGARRTASAFHRFLAASHPRPDGRPGLVWLLPFMGSSIAPKRNRDSGRRQGGDPVSEGWCHHHS